MTNGLPLIFGDTYFSDFMLQAIKEEFWVIHSLRTSLSHKSLMPERNLGVISPMYRCMKLGTQWVCGLSRILHWFSGTVITGEKKNLPSLSSVFILLLFFSLVSCKIALKSSSKSITSSIIPPFKTNLFKKTWTGWNNGKANNVNNKETNKSLVFYWRATMSDQTHTAGGPKRRVLVDCSQPGLYQELWAWKFYSGSSHLSWRGEQFPFHCVG